MLQDSWEEKQEGLFLFSWGGPDPRNTAEHIWWGVSHNDFFGKGERSRNKNNTDPTFHQSGGGGWEGWCGIIPLSLLKPRIPPHPKKSSLGLAACGCAGHQGQEQEKWSSLPGAARGPEFVTLLHGPGRGGDLPCVPSLHIITQCRTLGPQGRQNPQESPAGKSWGLWRHDLSCRPKRKEVKMRTQEKNLFRASEGQGFALGCCADLRCATSAHSWGILPDFCWVYLQGSTCGSQPSSCCVCAETKRLRESFADKQALQRVIPKVQLFQNLSFASAHKAILKTVHQKISPQL